MVGFTTRPLQPPGIEMKLDWPRSPFARFGDEKNLFALSEIAPRIAQPVGQSICQLSYASSVHSQTV